MGGEFWEYFVPFQADVEGAMQALQAREFAAGRYHSRRDCEPTLPVPTSIDDLRANYLTEEGSRSILDMMTVSDDPGAGPPEEMSDLVGDLSDAFPDAFGGVIPAFCTVVRVSDDELRRIFGTTQPTRGMIEASAPELAEPIERGCGIYVIAHRDGRPDEIYFAGYSFD
jgi:hypothetical protein